MSSYRIEFTAATAKELRKLDSGIRRRLLVGIGDLERDPRPAGCKKLAGASTAWRISVGDYWLLYDVVDDVLVVTVVRVAHRREVYK